MNTILFEKNDRVIIRVQGDRTKVNIPNLPRDGTRGTIMGFMTVAHCRITTHNIKPGLYEDKSMVLVSTERGTELVLPSEHMVFANKKTGSSRMAKYLSLHETAGNDDMLKLGFPNWIEPLPETLFWEGDEVVPVSPLPGVPQVMMNKQYIVREIHYLKYREGSREKVYGISENWNMSAQIVRVDESKLRLIAKGPLRNLHEKKPLTFKSAKHFLSFLTLFGILEVELFAITTQGKDVKTTLQFQLPYYV